MPRRSKASIIVQQTSAAPPGSLTGSWGRFAFYLPCLACATPRPGLPRPCSADLSDLGCSTVVSDDGAPCLATPFTARANRSMPRQCLPCPAGPFSCAAAFCRDRAPCLAMPCHAAPEHATPILCPPDESRCRTQIEHRKLLYAKSTERRSEITDANKTSRVCKHVR